ncbi:hypothetical protein [Streptomyces sp. NPDC004376]
MVGIRMPDEERLPPGPRRDLAAALHDLYALAGKPAARTISGWIRERDDLPGTLSHEGVSAVLRGTSTPRWNNLESLVRILVEKQCVGEAADVVTVVRQIHTFWRRADDGPQSPGPSLRTSPVTAGTDGAKETTPDQKVSEGNLADEGSGVAPETPRMREPLLRWDPRQRTLDVFDRQMAVEIIKEVGGVDGQP